MDEGGAEGGGGSGGGGGSEDDSGIGIGGGGSNGGEDGFGGSNDWVSLLPYSAKKETKETKESKEEKKEIKEEREAQQFLQRIRCGLAESVRAGEIAPGTCFWARQLLQYLELKFPLELKDREHFVELFYGLLVQQNVDPSLESLWTTVLCRLLKKRSQLRDSKLTLDWKPLLQKMMLEQFPQKRNRVYVDNTTSAKLINVASFARFYWPPGSFKEIMEIVRPLLFPYSIHIFIALGILEAFFPSNDPDVDAAIPDLVNLWNWFDHTPNWDMQWIEIFGRVAKNRIGHIDWTPYLPHIYSIYGLHFNLPVGSTRPRPPRASEGLINEFVSQAQMKFLVDMIVYSIYPGSTSLSELAKMIQATESFFHPSNTGKWTYTLVKFIRRLAYGYTRRIRSEGKPDCDVPKDYRLTPELNRQFVETLRPVVFLALFGKDNMVVVSATSSLRDLAHIAPDVVMPKLLELVYPALENLTEAHRMISSIAGLAGVATQLVSRSRYPVGATNVIPLFQLMLPGIDMNDPIKSYGAFQFLRNCLMGTTVFSQPAMENPPRTLEGDEDVRAALPELEAWLANFLDRAFNLLENMPDEQENSNSFNIEAGLSKSLLNTCSILFGQLSDDFFDLALGKVARFVEERNIRNARHVVGDLCLTVTLANPGRAFKKFIPLFIRKIREEIASGSGSDEEAHEQADSSLLWYQVALFSILKGGGRHVLDFRSDLTSLLEMLVVLPAKKVNQFAGKILRHLLRSLLATYPKESRSMNASEFSNPEFQSNHYQYWGTEYTVNEVQMEWHVPTRVEVEYGVELLKRFLVPKLQQLEKMIAEAAIPVGKNLTAYINELNRSLNIFQYIMRGIVTLTSYGLRTQEAEGKNSNVAEEEWNPEFGDNFRKVALEVGYCLTEPSDPLYVFVKDLRCQIGTLCHSLVMFLRQHLPDEVNTMAIVMKIINVYLSNRGIDYGNLSDRTQAHRMLKNNVVDPTRTVKKYPRYLIVKRAHYLHHRRLKYNMETAICTAIEERLMEDLFDLSTVNHYSQIRKDAQGYLLQGVKVYPKFKYSFTGKILDILSQPDVSTVMIKGALYTLKMYPFMNLCLRVWKYQAQFMTTLARAQYDEKPSIQELLRKIVSVFGASFHPLPIDYVEPASLADVATRIAEETGSRSSWSDQRVQRMQATQRDRMAGNRRIFEKLVGDLEGILESSPHWRFELMAGKYMEMLLNKKGMGAFDHSKFVWFYDHATDELPQMRSLSIRAVVRILYLLKPNPPIRRWMHLNDGTAEWPPYKRLLTNQPDVSIDEFAKKFSPEASKEKDITELIDDSFVGWNGVPRNYVVYIPNAPAPTLSGFNIEYFRSLVCGEEFWKKLGTLFSLEQRRTSDGGGNLYELFFFSIFRFFQDETLPYMFPTLEKLCGQTREQASQRAASEIVAGLLRGCRLWPVEKQKALQERLVPLLRSTFDAITPDSAVDWMDCLRNVLENQDPRRLLWLLDLIFVDDHLSKEPEYSFNEARKLLFMNTALQAMNWRIISYVERALKICAENLSHPYKNVRDQIGIVLSQVFLVKWHPTLVEHGSRVLRSFVEELQNTLRVEYEQHQQIPVEEQLTQQTRYVVTSKSVLNWMNLMLNTWSEQAGVPYLIPLLPDVILMMNSNDQDLLVMTNRVMELVPMQNLTPSEVESAVRIITDAMSSPVWHIRMKMLPVLQVLIFRHMFSLSTAAMDDIMNRLIDILLDPQVEVRESAAVTISGIIRCANRNSIEALLAKFRVLASEKLPKKTNDDDTQAQQNYQKAVLRRHAGILGLSALIQAFPYDLPPWMPRVLEAIAAHISDPTPIQKTVRKVVAEFRRTHQDTWHEVKGALSEEQIYNLSDILISPTYYA